MCHRRPRAGAPVAHSPTQRGAHFSSSCGYGGDISIGRPVTAAELADVVTFLASPRSVAVNGDAIAAGGGTRGPIHY